MLDLPRTVGFTFEVEILKLCYKNVGTGLLAELPFRKRQVELI
jgi:hypothetical protein